MSMPTPDEHGWYTVEGTDLRVRCREDKLEMKVYNSVRGNWLAKSYDRSVALDLAMALVTADEQTPDSQRVQSEQEVPR